MRTIEQMVQQEVNCCLSSLVSILAQGYCEPQRGYGTRNIEAQMEAMRSLYDQATELASPVLDYEEAAIQAGWRATGMEGRMIVQQQEGKAYPNKNSGSWRVICEQEGIDPYDREVYEHWAITQWLAEKLIDQGEKVDTDFAGLNVWARTTTGQSIACDGVIERIYQAMMVPA